ncbi:MAG: molybdate ABC transporter substrate-binding protein [Sulfurimonas sp.]|nr:molybdate ABC transporter substrate-binding protein [Sulfurimonas sp.]
MLKRLFLSFMLLTSALYSNTINIAVAANVSYAMDSLIAEFNKINPNTKVNVTLGSSGKLTAKIIHGAPYDIFMSANMKFPYAVYEKGLSVIEPKIYAYGSLAILSFKKRDLSKGIMLLKDENIKRIAIANPKTAPYGNASFEALKNAKILNKIKSKFIYGESISSTVSYTIIATDIGIVAKSSLYSSKMTRFKKNENWIEIDSKLYTPIKQGIVIIKNTREVKEFYDFILSKSAKKIFKSYGYQVP